MSDSWAEQTSNRLLNAVPGYRGYREKESRRDADRAVRQRLADALAGQATRVERIATTLADERNLSAIGPVNDLVTAIRYLRDRILSASYGYGGILGDRDIDAGVLDQLRLFDESLFAGIDQIESGIAGVESAQSSGGDLTAAVKAASSSVTAAGARFDLRSRVFDSATPASPAEVASALDVLKSPEERKAAAQPPAAYELHDRDAIAILGDNFVVDARIDIESTDGAYRLFRIDVVPEKWLLVPRKQGEPFGSLTATNAAYSSTVPPTIGDESFAIESSGHGSGDLVGIGGQSGRRPVSYTLLRGATETNRRAIVLQWGSEQQVLTGKDVHPDDVEIFGKPT